MMLHLPSFFFLARPMQHFGINLCKAYMNDDPKMTLTYIMAKSNVVIGVLGVGITECIK